jgi:hypothetical protein
MIAGVTLHNFLLNGTLAVLFIIALKWAAQRTGVAGLQHIADAV